MDGVQPRPFASAFLMSMAIISVGCGNSGPATPGSPSPPLVRPNDTPTITALTLSSVRAEAGQDLAAMAVVQDTDTPVDELSYQWSALPVNGVFSGTGRQVTWTPPKAQKPGIYTVKVKVTEHDTESRAANRNTASATVPVHYNDSNQDIMTISMRFLTQLFPDFSVSAQQAVQDFSTSTTRQPDGTICARETASELSDVTNNRIYFHILSGTYTNVSIALNGDRTFADVFGTCVFEDIPTDPSSPLFGKRERVTGICHLTAVYEGWKWLLCESHIQGIDTSPEVLKYRVPGRIIGYRE